MTEENRIILEKRHARHEGMIQATFGIAMIAVALGLAAYVRTL